MNIFRNMMWEVKKLPYVKSKFLKHQIFILPERIPSGVQPVTPLVPGVPSGEVHPGEYPAPCPDWALCPSWALIHLSWGCCTWSCSLRLGCHFVPWERDCSCCWALASTNWTSDWKSRKKQSCEASEFPSSSILYFLRLGIVEKH